MECGTAVEERRPEDDQHQEESEDGRLEEHGPWNRRRGSRGAARLPAAISVPLLNVAEAPESLELGRVEARGGLVVRG